MKTFSFALFASLFSGYLFANPVATHIKKLDDSNWIVQYSAHKAVEKLVFRRNPNQSRAKRWTPASADFVIGFEDGKEIIKRKDGKPFTTSTFQLTPTYTPLPKDYAPFSPFSDGGMLIHSGRFFVCANECAKDFNHWEIALTAPEHDNVIVNGSVFKGSTSWSDMNSGRKVYVGAGKPIQDDYFLSVVDKRLPAVLASQMAEQLPGLMEYFSKKLGKLDFTPTMFASFSEPNNGSYGNQGGTLNDQIFMHWYGEKAISRLDGKAVYWFFAHEVGHLHQQEGAKIVNRHDAWLHEGSAEFFAAQASPDSGFVNDKLATSKQKCLATLKDNSNYKLASAKNSKLHYNCGLTLFAAIQNELNAAHPEMDVFGLWTLFSRAIKAGEEASAPTFIQIAKPYLSKEMLTLLSELSSDKGVVSLKLIE